MTLRWCLLAMLSLSIGVAPADAVTSVAPLDWGQVSTVAAPAGRDFAAMAYDSGHGRTVLFGGDQALNGSSTLPPPYFADT